MTDLTYAVVKAAARKGELLTNQQLNDLASSRDIKEFVSRVKDRYPVLAASQMPKLKELEEGLLQTFKTDVSEFVKAAPDAKELLQLIAKELEEENATDLLKWKLGVLDQSKLENMPKKMTKEDAGALIAKMGFKEESEDATKLFEKYNAPGLIDSIFTRDRLIKIAEVIQNNDYEGLVKYLKLKIDLYNIVTIMRGLKNGADKKALEEILILNGGGINSQQLKEATKSNDVQKALAYFEGIGLPKVDTPRELEKSYEVKIARTLNRAFYSGYMDIGAIVGYLELRMREIKNIIRVANAISRSIDPKKISQEFIF